MPKKSKKPKPVKVKRIPKIKTPKKKRGRPAKKEITIPLKVGAKASQKGDTFITKVVAQGTGTGGPGSRGGPDAYKKRTKMSKADQARSQRELSREFGIGKASAEYKGELQRRGGSAIDRAFGGSGIQVGMTGSGLLTDKQKEKTLKEEIKKEIREEAEAQARADLGGSIMKPRASRHRTIATETEPFEPPPQVEELIPKRRERVKPKSRVLLSKDDPEYKKRMWRRRRYTTIDQNAPDPPWLIDEVLSGMGQAWRQERARPQREEEGAQLIQARIRGNIARKQAESQRRTQARAEEVGRRAAISARRKAEVEAKEAEAEAKEQARIQRIIREGNIADRGRIRAVIEEPQDERMAISSLLNPAPQRTPEQVVARDLTESLLQRGMERSEEITREQIEREAEEQADLDEAIRQSYLPVDPAVQAREDKKSKGRTLELRTEIPEIVERQRQQRNLTRGRTLDLTEPLPEPEPIPPAESVFSESGVSVLSDPPARARPVAKAKVKAPAPAPVVSQRRYAGRPGRLIPEGKVQLSKEKDKLQQANKELKAELKAINPSFRANLFNEQDFNLIWERVEGILDRIAGNITPQQVGLVNNNTAMIIENNQRIKAIQNRLRDR